MKQTRLPLDLQFFAGSAGEGTGEGQDGQSAGQLAGMQNQTARTQAGAAPQLLVTNWERFPRIREANRIFIVIK